MDPFSRPNPTREGVVRLVSRLALLWGLLYVVWRAVTTLQGTAPAAAGFLLLAEVLGLVTFAARTRSASATPITPVEVPDAPTPHAVAVIEATGASIDELRTTLVSTRRVAGLDRVIVVDHDGSRWLRSIADRFGATFSDGSRTELQVVAEVSAPWVLRMIAGDLPMPDLLEMAAATCSAPDIGVVQLGIEEADPASFEHDPTGRWSLEPFEHQVVRPSLASRGSIPWYGDGPVLVRPAALSSAGLGAEQPSTPDLGVRILAAGFRITHLPITLARVRGPRTLGESLARRQTRLAPQIRTALSPSIRQLRRPERVAHQLCLVAPLSAVQRILLVATAMLTMGFAQIPLTASAAELAGFAIPAYGLRWVAHLLLGRGRLGPFSILRSDLRSVGVDISLFGESRDRRRGSLGLLALLVAVIDVVVIVTAISVWRDWGDRLPAEVAAVALAIAGGFLGVAMEVLLDAAARRQRRQHHRVRLGLVTCRLQELDGQLVDLSTGGAGVVLPCGLETAPEPETVTTMAFRIPDADGAWRSVTTLVHVAHRAVEGDNETRVGLTFDDPTDAPLDPVVEFLTIDRRLVALGRRDASLAS